MNRVSVVRAQLKRLFLAPAALAGALLLAGCYGEEGYQLPSRAMKELSPEMVTLLDQKNMPRESPILVRIFKEESELEVWKQDTTGRFALVKVYPICRWSGDLGPKVREGDRQAPEGFYAITPGLMNPNSNYYLAINTGFPNAYDKANNRTGAFLMIHGDCSSRGCYAMTDEQIGEIYSLARESFLGGQKSFQIQAYPFRMTPLNMARHRNNPNIAFWKMLKEGNDHFEVSRLEPRVDVCDRHYVFDAVPPANSTKPLAFSPTGRCPAFQTDPEIADDAMQKQRNDDYQFAELVSRNTPVAPSFDGYDGGMNRVFAAKLDNPTYTYDNEGHVHVPPLQPGRAPPVLSAQASPTVSASSPGQQSASSGSGLFGNLFSSNASASTTRVASTETPAQSHTGFFSSLFGSKSDAPSASRSDPATTASTPKSKPATQTASTAVPRAKPATEARKSEPSKSDQQQADATKPVVAPAQPQKQANVAPPPAQGATVITGAQPVLPTGSFDGRWSGVQ